MSDGGIRVALYSPGMVGLGHLRRNILLVRRFAAVYPDAAFLLLTEAREAGTFSLPDNADCISLPAIRKNADGACAPRRLPIDLPAVVRLRARVLAAALAEFSPDVLIVDHLPRGALGELESVLRRLRARGTRLVLGLRDILEEPRTVWREWLNGGHAAAIEQWYDRVWVYGDPRVFDPLTEYAFPPGMAELTRFTGYLDPFADATSSEPANADDLAARLFHDRRVMLCQLGGGQDGVRLAETFLDAELPDDAEGVVVTGPFMAQPARRDLAERARARPRMHVLSFITEPAGLLRQAERVVTMGGYNSVCEVIALRKRALVVPRTQPRREQLIRAARMAELGLLETLDPGELTPAALTRWLARPPGDTPRARALEMRGLDRAVELLALELEAAAELARPAARRALRASA